MRYRLRTLMIALALGPPMLAAIWWAWPRVAETDKQRAIANFDELIALITATLRPDSWDDVGGPGSIDSFSTICCFGLVEVEDGPVGPDPCGRNFSFWTYSQDKEDEFETPLATESTVIASPSADPFAPR